jgi:hypothetical protein
VVYFLKSTDGPSELTGISSIGGKIATKISWVRGNYAKKLGEFGDSKPRVSN